jgi:hypothetical protein
MKYSNIALGRALAPNKAPLSGNLGRYKGKDQARPDLDYSIYLPEYKQKITVCKK